MPSMIYQKWWNPTARLAVLLVVLLVGDQRRVVDALTTTTTTTTASLEERAALLELLPQSGFIGGSPAQVGKVCDACTNLETASAANPTTATLNELDGTWKLRFTSASPYGLMRLLPEDTSTLLMDGLPEPVRKFLIDQSVLLPLSIEQRIDGQNRRIVNVVDLAPWPKNSGSNESDNNPIQNALQQALSSVPGPLGETIEALQDATVRLELDHAISENSDSIELTLETVRRKLESVGEKLPSFIPKESNYNLPAPLNPSGSFETTYVDSTLYIARGKSFPFDNEVFVLERVGGDKVSTSELLQDDPAFVDEECELTYDEDGETLVMLCENDEDGDDYMPSD